MVDIVGPGLLAECQSRIVLENEMVTILYLSCVCIVVWVVCCMCCMGCVLYVLYGLCVVWAVYLIS